MREYIYLPIASTLQARIQCDIACLIQRICYMKIISQQCYYYEVFAEII